MLAVTSNPVNELGISVVAGTHGTVAMACADWSLLAWCIAGEAKADCPPPPSCSINSVLIPVGLNLKPKGSLSYHELLVLSVIFPVFSFHFC